MRQTPELILHIGHFKTGTTALQVFMAQNRGLLARAGLAYAQTAIKNAKHSALAFALLHEAGVTSLMYGYRGAISARDQWQILFDEVRAQPAGRATLVSSEEFMRLGAHPRAVDLMHQIMTEAPDIKVRVIAYLRPPQAHLRSWYNQMIKLGNTVGGFDAALHREFEPIHRDYAMALHPWIELFGPEAVLLRGFDDCLRDGDALYRDFLDALGVTIPRRAKIPPRDPNPRLDDRLLPLRRALNAAALPRQAASALLQQMDAALAQRDGEGEGRDLDAIRDASRAGISWLSTLPGAAFDAGRLLNDLPRENTPQEQAAEALAESLTDEIVRLRRSNRRLQTRLKALKARRDDASTGEA